MRRRGEDEHETPLGRLCCLPWACRRVERVEPRFHWRLVAADPDDDKFVDAYLAADVLVTHDAHFDVLADLDFPPVTVLSADGFKEALQQAG